MVGKALLVGHSLELRTLIWRQHTDEHGAHGMPTLSVCRSTPETLHAGSSSLNSPSESTQLTVELTGARATKPPIIQ